MQSYRAHTNSANQHGTVLIVSLVMLTILTILAVGTTSDVGLQTNMTQNSQISLRAFNTSLSQLKTIYNDLKKDDAYQEILGDLLLSKAAITDTVTASSSNPFNTTTRVFQVASNEDDSEGGANVHGGELGNSMVTSIYTFDLNSSSTLPSATGIGSDQTFKVIYKRPPSRN